METWAAANEEQARYWNGGESARWLGHEERYELLGPGARLVTVNGPWQ